MKLGKWFVKSKCGMCGDGPQGHRMFDWIADRFIAGDTIEDLATDYKLPAAQIEHVVWLELRRRYKKQNRTDFFKELSK